MIRRPPRSTLFPTRRSSDLSPAAAPVWVPLRRRTRRPAPAGRRRPRRGGGASVVGDRSEEHTSELQSQSNLVCRLLLEKKNASETTPGIRAANTVHLSTPHA